MKKCENVWKSAKKCGKVPRRFCPLVAALSFFSEPCFPGEISQKIFTYSELIRR